MNYPNISASPWQEAVLSASSLDEIIEEVRQLRASLAIYQKLVERLLEEQKKAA
jgi:hypothetical protein